MPKLNDGEKPRAGNSPARKDTQRTVLQNHQQTDAEQVGKQERISIEEYILITVTFLFALPILYTMMVVAFGWKVDTDLLKALLQYAGLPAAAALGGGTFLFLRGKKKSE